MRETKLYREENSEREERRVRVKTGDRERMVAGKQEWRTE